MGIRKNNYIILTGAMGAGKTAILNKLKERNYFCISEPAREILKEQRLIGGAGVPEKDPELFVQLMLSRMIHQYECNLETDKIIFFDRGIPDMTGYSDLLKTNAAPCVNAANEFRYNNTVFFLNGVKDIYTNDDERKVDFNIASGFGISLKKIYPDFGYNLIDVPFGNVEERAEFVLKSVENKKI